MKKPVEIYQKFLQFFRNNEVRPAKRFEYNGYDVYIFEGGPFNLKNDYDWHKKKHDFPEGLCYEAGFGVAQGQNYKFAMAWPVRYFHNITDTPEGRRDARINAATDEARKAIDAYQNRQVH